MDALSELPITLGGETIVLRGDRSMYWAARRTLVVADLHLGKTESLRREGIALPDGVMDDDLARLARALDATGATRLLVLGDLVHDARGLTRTVLSRFATWLERRSTDVHLVIGNHDRRAMELLTEWRLVVHVRPLVEEPFVFAHDIADVHERERATPDAGAADASQDVAFISCVGHVHPVITLRGRSDRLRLPCFHVQADALTLPAFSVFTGGAEVARRQSDRVVALANDCVVEIPEVHIGKAR